MNKFMLCTCGALLASVSMAATEVSVTGNNTAVVIQKDVVMSATGYQFLCVPVKGFDISGKGGVEVAKLGELLPPATMKAGAQLTVGNKTYIVQNLAGDSAPEDLHWVESPEGGGARGFRTFASPAPQSVDTSVALTKGSIFWLKTQSKDVPPTVFCGEENTGLTAIPAKVNGTIQVGNQSAEKIDIVKEFTEANGYILPRNPNEFAYIYVLRNGANDYTIYCYESLADGKTMSWTYAPEGAFVREAMPENTVFINPGEAFYLQNVGKKSAN